MEAAGCQSKHYPALFGTFLRGRADDDVARIGESRRGVCRDSLTRVRLFPASMERAAHQDIYNYLLGYAQRREDPAQVSERPQYPSFFFVLFGDTCKKTCTPTVDWQLSKIMIIRYPEQCQFWESSNLKVWFKKNRHSLILSSKMFYFLIISKFVRMSLSPEFVICSHFGSKIKSYSRFMSKPDNTIS